VIMYPCRRQRTLMKKTGKIIQKMKAKAEIRGTSKWRGTGKQADQTPKRFY